MAPKTRRRAKTPPQPFNKKTMDGRRRTFTKSSKIHRQNGYDFKSPSYKKTFAEIPAPTYAYQSARLKASDDPSEGIHCRGALATYNANLVEADLTRALQDALPKLIARLQQKPSKSKKRRDRRTGKHFINAAVLALARRSKIIGKRYPRTAYDFYLEIKDGSGASTFHGIAQQTRMAHNSSQKNTWNTNYRFKVQASVAEENQIAPLVSNKGIFIASGNDLKQALEAQQVLGDDSDVENSDEEMEEDSDDEMDIDGEEMPLLELEENGSGNSADGEFEAEDATDEDSEEGDEDLELVEDEELAGSELGSIDVLKAGITLCDNAGEVLYEIFEKVSNKHIKYFFLPVLIHY